MKDKRNRFEIRLSDEDTARLDELKQASGLPRSEIVRQAIHRTRTWTVKDREGIRALTRELAKIGNNINQIARQLNQSSDLDTLTILAQIEADLQDIKNNAH